MASMIHIGPAEPLKTGVAAAALHVHGGTHERSDSFDSRPEAVREKEDQQTVTTTAVTTFCFANLAISTEF